MTITVGTITPVYAGEQYLRGLAEALSTVRQQWIEEQAPVSLYESIFAVDGAVDNSLAVLQELEQEYDFIKIVELSRNYGQHAATSAGICHSSADWIVTLDEDLQHHPKEIDTLFKEQAKHKADVVYALPKTEVHGNSWRDFSSKFTKKVMSALTGTPQIKYFNSFRLIRGNIARAAASSSSSQTYLDIALTWFTKSFASSEIEMEDERYVTSKSSGYGLLKLIKHARKLIISSDVDVASAGMVVGISTIALAVLVGLVVILQKVFFPETVASDGWASTIAVITFFSGIIISLICIMLEYVNIIAINQLGKPTFFTADRSTDSALKDWYQAK